MKLKRLLQLVTLSVFFLTVGLLCTNPTSMAAKTNDANRCGGITLENAATILAVSPDDLRKSSSPMMVSPDDLQKKIYKTPPYTCRIRSKSNFLKSIAYVTYVYNDPGQAFRDFKKMKEGFESASRVDVVPGIGDGAFWAGDKRFQRMVAMKGGIIIDVSAPTDPNLQKLVIRLVLDAE